jgi:outer membrane lipoprotein SlyB
MRSITPKIGLVTLTVLLVAACSSQPRYDNTCNNCGTVERIERIQLQDQHQSIGAGAVIGAIIGGAAGSQVGSDDNQTVAIAAGAVVGSVIGHQVQKRSNANQSGYLFEVRLDDGRWAKVTQLGNLSLRVGSRVIIVNDEVQRLR